MPQTESPGIEAAPRTRLRWWTELPLILGQLPVLSRAYWSTRAFERTTLEAPLGSGPYRLVSRERKARIGDELRHLLACRGAKERDTERDGDDRQTELRATSDARGKGRHVRSGLRQ